MKMLDFRNRPNRPSGQANPTRRMVMPVLLGIAMLASACGGSSSGSPGVASEGSTTSTTSASAATGSSSSSSSSAAAKFADCMRSHGVPNFPDPVNGQIKLQSKGGSGGNGIDPNSQQFKAAQQTCTKLVPNFGQAPSAAQSQALQTQMLKHAQCMRSHGVPNYPDPTFSGGAVSMQLKNIDPNSPQFKSASSACQSLLPKGLQSSSS